MVDPYLQIVKIYLQYQLYKTKRKENKMSIPQFETTLGDLFEQVLGDYIDGHLKINNERMTPQQATEYFAKEAKELGYHNEQIADCSEELMMTLQDTIIRKEKDFFEIF